MKEIGLFTPLLHTIQGVRNLIIQEKGNKSKLSNGLGSLKFELELMQTEIEKDGDEALQELAYDIEDFLHGLVTPGLCRSFVLTTLGANPDVDHLARVELFKEKIKALKSAGSKTAAVAAGATSAPSEARAAAELCPGSVRVHPILQWVLRVLNLFTVILSWAFASRLRPEAPAAGRQLVGIAKPKMDILELLLPTPAELRVISIVGCGGLGKTALARELYDDPAVAAAFPCRAWVVASERDAAADLHSSSAEEPAKKNAAAVLKKILQQVRPTQAESSDGTSDVGQLREELRQFLHRRTSRYLVVVDGIENIELWGEIEPAFPNDDSSGSRIILTTSIQSIATSHSPGSYLYTLQGLDIYSSQRLFWREIYGSPSAKPASAIADASESILSKCDGLPLALVSTAKNLGQNPTVKKCRDIGQALGSYLDENKPGFGELKRALVQCYDSLPAYRLRRCLLSVSMFPKGHEIKKKSLLRRWIAEGLAYGEGQRGHMDVASSSFTEFVDRSIIHPVLIGNNSEVKRCQVQGTMLEFIVHKSITRANFVTLIHKDEQLPRNRGAYPIRRLSVHDGTEESISSTRDTNLSVIRWLTIFKCNSVPSNLSTCKLLRVLDLEDCSGIDDKVLASICKLMFLKYLSLRGSDVNMIPMEITKLRNLETLDIRQTKVTILPMEVIMMPGLVHLFGQFELAPPKRKDFASKILTVNPKGNNMKKFFSGKKSSLQTLAGVVIDNDDRGLQNIMRHATKLKKVKLWCKTDCWSRFPLEKLTATEEALDSLSIISTHHLPMTFLSQGFLDDITGCCAISSIKLSGALGELATSVTLSIKLAKLEELQLSSTGLSSEHLSALQSLPVLMYLKLAEDSHGFGNGSFDVRGNGFPCLIRLCIEAPRLPPVRIEQGAMPHVTSLQLLHTGQNENFDGLLGVEGISHLAKLNEVILHHSADDRKMKAWEDVAKMHLNRPYVKKQPRSNSTTA